MGASVALMKNAARHKDIIDAKSSEMIKAMSDTEWLVYYRFAGMGPIPGSDCVATMTISENIGGVKRMSLYDMSYRFLDAGNGKVEITTSARICPPSRCPSGWSRRAIRRLPPTL